MNENNYQVCRNWGLAEAIVGVAAIVCLKEIIVEGLKALTQRNNNKKEEKK